MTPFQIGALALAADGVTTRDLAGDKRRPDGNIGDLLFLANAARKG
jgi:hypothetical protein